MRFRFLLPAVFAATALSGCDRALQTAPYDRVGADQEIVDAATAQAALNGAYDAFQSGSAYGLDIQMLGDLPADNAQWAGTYQFLGDVASNRITADNPEVTAMWTALYRQVDRDNLILQKVTALANIPDATKKNITGQAYFLRALAYHDLVKFWGGVPMPLTPVVLASDATKYTRASVNDVYTQILSDLDKAAAGITNTDVHAATQTAVKALRARVLFYRADYAGALTQANAVLAGRDTLTVAFPALFAATGTTTTEDIFRVSFTASESNSLGYYYLYAGRYEVAPTANLNSAFETGDVRKAWSIQFRPNSTTRFQGTKFPTTIGAESPHVIRLAEVVLIKAEALARTNDLAGSVAEYNKVRVRAGLKPHVLGTDVKTQADVLAAIDKERRLELAFEGDRWPDLVRQGRAAQVKGFTDRPGQALFPIPLRDMTTTPGLVQNPGY